MTERAYKDPEFGIVILRKNARKAGLSVFGCAVRVIVMEVVFRLRYHGAYLTKTELVTWKRGGTGFGRR